MVSSTAFGSEQRRSSYSQSFASGSPIAEASISRDLAAYDDDGDSSLSIDDDQSEATTVRVGDSPRSLARSYRRPSFFTAGSRGTIVPHSVERDVLSQLEMEQAMNQERALLRDNNIISRENSQTQVNSTQQRGFSGLLRQNSSTTEEADIESIAEAPIVRVESQQGQIATETTALLRRHSRPEDEDPAAVDRKWEAAVGAELIHTSWQREALVLGKYSAPLMPTFMLQYSLSVASIFTVGHLGKVELSAVSLASMTASITGLAVYFGLVTSLDTLCAQAYGSGRKELVGLQVQRMICFLLLVTIPISICWFFADKILMVITPETEAAVLAGKYLKIVILGAPGLACFESGKRFLQAQGIFTASLYVLLICAPLNAFMHWLFVWKLEWGFIGAPISVAISQNLLALLLFLYVYFVAGSECWGGFSKQAFQNWGPMIRLAIPGLLMVEAEYLAFEILTLASAYFGTTALAAQSVLSTVAAIMYQIPFTLAIAGSTRVANLIGAALVDAALIAARVSILAAIVVGLMDMTILSTLRLYIPRLFTSDEDVITLVAQLLPICAAYQLFDSMAANCNGILRSLGRQEFGGYVQVLCYYVVAIPISMGTSFGLEWGLPGLWSGIAIALFLVVCIESVFLLRTSWQRSVDEARKRNSLG